MTGFDLIIFAVLAVFLGWKLYTVLGRRTGNERSIDPFITKPGSAPTGTPNSEPASRTPRLDAPANEDVPPQREERNVLPREQRQLEAVIAQAPESARKGLEAIRAADPEFDAVSFLAGSKIAFDMILSAFAAGDANALKPLLAPLKNSTFAAAKLSKNSPSKN